MTLRELWLLVALGAMLLIPGWAILSVGGAWRRWKGLQRWIVAIGLGIAFYPVLFYLLRAIAPPLRLGPYKLAALLLAGAGWAIWRLRGQWRELVAFDRQEWIAIAIFGMTLFSRFWIIRDHPYPAWSDSLHHTLLTQLTAELGQLPETLEPYFPVPLGHYHLGLYALTAPVMWLSRVPAHTALLWTSQLLNGLCGLGVYLILDRKVSRQAGIVGAVVVGLLSHQPALYVNWGRFTQVASQSILLIAWAVTWDSFADWRHKSSGAGFRLVWQTLIAALLSSSVFLLHFRVAAFYLPLLLITGLWELGHAVRSRRAARLVAGVTLVGLLTVAVSLPALWDGAASYVDRVNAQTAPAENGPTEEVVDETVEGYYAFDWSTVPHLAAHTWLLGLAALSAVVGILRRNKTVLVALAWILSLIALGNIHRLNVPLLNLTNMGAILIMLYLPIGLIIGSAVAEGLTLIPEVSRGRAGQAVMAVVLAAGFAGSHARAADLETWRYFVAPGDVEAMDWIRSQTEPDALFAVNTFFWLPYAPHGTDAGYWIPYFTGRDTTAGVMLLSLGDADYYAHFVELARLVETLEVDDAAVDELAQAGVDYIYIGPVGDFSGPGLNASKLGQSPDLELVYQRDGVSILSLSAASQ